MYKKVQEDPKNLDFPVSLCKRKTSCTRNFFAWAGCANYGTFRKELKPISAVVLFAVSIH